MLGLHQVFYISSYNRLSGNDGSDFTIQIENVVKDNDYNRICLLSAQISGLHFEFEQVFELFVRSVERVRCSNFFRPPLFDVRTFCSNFLWMRYAVLQSSIAPLE